MSKGIIFRAGEKWFLCVSMRNKESAESLLRLITMIAEEAAKDERD